ncbi:MAG: hypothetical protein ACOYLE_01565 [Bacteroidales bacterium]
MFTIIKNQLGIESPSTLVLMNELKNIKEQGFLNKKQFLKILHWKSPRPLKHYNSNLEEEIIEITKLAFNVENDIMKLHILTSLNGVKYPSASAILMFYNPLIYPVLDIRVWRQLYYAKLVDTNEKGQNFKYQDCAKYYTIIRALAVEFNLSARQVEKRIFDYDIENQIGSLYKS